MTNNAIFAAAEPTQLCLEIYPNTQNQAWRNQEFSTPGSRWNAYLNELCLEAVLPWLQEEYRRVNIWPSRAALPSFWEVVNGTAVRLNETRLVLVPHETIDLSELRVPQEWIDIPAWTADYYLAVQVEPDEGWVRIWGYATHEQLKKRGSYDAEDRTYCLEEDELIKDINALWVARQLCPDEVTRAAVAPLSLLSLVQANNLLQRLGNPDILVPRQAVPFTLWGALLEHGGWRQRLYQRRLGRQEQGSVLQWLSGISEFAQQLGWQLLELQPQEVGARGAETAVPQTILSRQLVIAEQAYELQVLPQGNLEERIWRFQLRNTSLAGNISAGFKLRLLTEDLQPFENNEDIAITEVEQLYVDVAVEPGEGLVWEVEPTPENCDREILRF